MSQASSIASGRVVTLTPNPTLDAISEVGRGVFLETLGGRDVLRVPPFRYQVGGKGITCARVLKALGGKHLAVVLLGRDGVSRCVEYYLRNQNLKIRIVRTSSLGRIALIVTETEESAAGVSGEAATGVDYRINGKGSPAGPEVLQNLMDVLRRSLHGASALALAGSLPEGAPADYYGQCISLGRSLVPLVMLDSSGTPLLHGAMARPHLIKINSREAADLMDEAEPGTISEAAALAWRIAARFNAGDRVGGVEKVIITMGSLGAAAVDGKTGAQWAVRSPKVRARGALGAGDSFSAGLAYALTSGRDFPEALRWGAACGAATAEKRPGEVGDRGRILELFDQVEIVPLEIQAEVAAASAKPSG
ncbi:MAG: 1-phosphofructokinase family hexose kinase [Patescibacteria group bacterium]